MQLDREDVMEQVVSPQLERSTPVLKTADYERARAFYCDTLGYKLAEEGGTPARFGIFKRGGSIIFVNGWQGGPTPVPGAWDAYVHVVGLEALLAGGTELGQGEMAPVAPELGRLEDGAVRLSSDAVNDANPTNNVFPQ